MVSFAKWVEFEFWIFDCGEKVGAGIFKMSGLLRDTEFAPFGILRSGEANASIVVRFDQEGASTPIECCAVGSQLADLGPARFSCGHHTKGQLIMRRTPAASAAASIRSAPSRVAAMSFSTR